MGTLTSGQINVRTLRAYFDGTLDDVVEGAAQSLYPHNPEQETAGWGNFNDDEAPIGQSSQLEVHASKPLVVAESESKPRRAYMRLYYDKVDVSLRKVLGTESDWRQLCIRQAVDVILFEGDRESGFQIQVASRDENELTRRIIPELKSVLLSIDAKARMDRDLIPEVLSPDIFAWLLARFSQGLSITEGLSLDTIREIRSADGMMRGARFTETANVDRVDIASLILEGSSDFGPAKLSMTSAGLDLSVDLELFLDGGFSVYRSSAYGSEDIPSKELGPKLIEDLSLHLLPEMRQAYNLDDEWRNDGHEKLRVIANRKMSPYVSI